MKRFHVHLGVRDLAESVGFYSALFGAPPTVIERDYAKWMLEDPRVNFAISTHGPAGLDHLGVQLEDAAELRAAAMKLEAAGKAVVHQDDAVCCYARSDKAWVADPQGVAWETFFSHGAATVYGEDRRDEIAGPAAACCAPRPDLSDAKAAETCSISVAPKTAACCGN